MTTEFRWVGDEETVAHPYLRPVLAQWLGAMPGPVLDLGCGNGVLTGAIAATGLSIEGADMSGSGVAAARANFPELVFHDADLTRPLPDDLHGRFGSVMSAEVIEHLTIPGAVFDRAREAAPHGHLIVTTPYHGYLKNLALAAVDGFDNHWNPLNDAGHIKFFSIATLTRLAADRSYEVVRVHRVGRIAPLAKSMILEFRPR